MARMIEKIQCFEAFRDTMLDYFSRYTAEEEGKRKSTVSHRIAMLMKNHVPQDAEIDIDLDGADILLRRNNSIDLAVFWSSTYLTEKEKDKARSFHKKNNPYLTLAFSLLEDKDYLLVYRFEKDYLEYLHINKQDFSERLLKRCMLEDKEEADQQLLLDIKGTKKKKKKTKTNDAEPVVATLSEEASSSNEE